MAASSTTFTSSSDSSFFSSSSSSSKAYCVSASSTPNVLVTTRKVSKPHPGAGPVQVPSSTGVAHSASPRRIPQSSSPSSSSSSPLSTPPPDNISISITKPKQQKPKPKKRKSLPADDEPYASSGGSNSSDLIPRDVKRLRKSYPKLGNGKHKSPSSSKASSRASSRRASSPEPIYRSDRSRSTSILPSVEPTRHKEILLRKGDEEWTASDSKKLLNSEHVVKGLLKSYKSFFANPDDPNDPAFAFDPDTSTYPAVTLEYPAHGASENFILLAPKDPDHYNPILDFEHTLYTIVECYLTKEQRAIFGPVPSNNLLEIISPPSSPSPSPSPPSSIRSTSSTDSNTTSTPSSTVSSGLPVLRAIQRAIHLQHGPLFMNAMKQINEFLCDLKYPRLLSPWASPSLPSLPSSPSSTSSTLSTTYGILHRIPTWSALKSQKVLMRIIEENYQRLVGPNVPLLKHYTAFSSTVYGELLPPLISEIISFTAMHPGSLFLDLGSGVANVCVQASLQSGCTSYGIEMMPHPARVAQGVVEQMKLRCKMYGVKMGEVELEEGDMLKSRRLDELIPKADVVLVDNKVFVESLNEALRPKFLDLKEGAYVVSLKPFVNSINARVTMRNLDDMSAIFDVQEKVYHPGSVSWGSNGGTYYIHRVDREGYARLKLRYESMHGGGRRTRRG